MATVSRPSGQNGSKDQLAERRRLQNQRALTDTSEWRTRLHPHVWSPPTDLYETESAYVVRVEVAGLREQDFSVTFDNNYLTISGSRPDQPERRSYHQMEVRFGEFSTIASIPGPVDPEQATAEYEDGFLIVTLKKLHP